MDAYADACLHANPLQFDEEKHEYRLRGKVLPSVTRIIRGVFPAFQADEYYLRRGTALHLAAALSDRGTLDPSSVDEPIAGRLKAWQRFRREFPAEIVSMEKPMASAKYQFAGTPDRVMSGGVIVDLKSSYEPISIAQIGGYSILHAENGGGRCKKGSVVELSEDETYKCYWLDATEMRRAEQVFLAALACYGFMQSHGLTWQRR